MYINLASSSSLQSLSSDESSSLVLSLHSGMPFSSRHWLIFMDRRLLWIKSENVNDLRVNGHSPDPLDSQAVIAYRSKFCPWRVASGWTIISIVMGQMNSDGTSIMEASVLLKMLDGMLSGRVPVGWVRVFCLFLYFMNQWQGGFCQNSDEFPLPFPKAEANKAIKSRYRKSHP